MIKLQIIGALGKDAIRNDVNGRGVINFSVAHSERFKDAQGTERQKTIWVSCSYWTDKTGVLPYLLKGTTVYVEGQPEVGTYQTQDRQTHAQLKLRVQSIQLLGGNKDRQQQGQPAQNNEADNITEPIDDLPF